MTWIYTSRRQRFDFLDPDPGSIYLEDIAQGLLSPRFNRHGTTGVVVSIAEHSHNVMRRVRDLGGTREEQRTALMHDAPEAYTGDVPGPLKEAMRALAPTEGSLFDELEDLAWRAIRDRFALDDITPIVKQADKEIQSVEAMAVFGEVPEDWIAKRDVEGLVLLYPVWGGPGDIHRARFLRACEELDIR